MSDTLTVLGVMTPFPIHASPDTSIVAAESIMRGHEIRHLPVQDAAGVVVGVVNHADLRLGTELLADREAPIERLCVQEPLVIDSDATLKQAVVAMAERGVDAALVLRSGRMVGILTLSDIAEVLLRVLPGPDPRPLSTDGSDGVA